MSASPFTYSLNPKLPEEVNRFAHINSIQLRKEPASPSISQLQLVARTALTTLAQSTTELGDILTHPEGRLIFHHDAVISAQNITRQHITLADHILDQCGDLVANTQATVFIEIRDHQADYYVIVHKSKTIAWIVDQGPESFKGATRAKHEHEYWIHMENFPGPHFSTPEDLRSLKHQLRSDGIDALIPQGLASPTSVEKTKAHLAMLDLFSGEGDMSQTYVVAQLWGLILSRTTTKHGALRAHSEKTIGRATSIEEVIDALTIRGCTDLTSSIDQTACSNHPCAGGGFCDVYRGALRGGTKIGIKLLRVYDVSQLGGDNDSQKILKRAARELYHWSKLEHRNALSLLGLAIFKGHLSMISEWMENGDLKSYLKRKPDADRIKLCMDICTGLRYIHIQGMAHGDLKAVNVMVSLDGVAMIGDFGSALWKDLSLKFSDTPGHGFSFRWAAPELFEDNGRPSKEADVYAYGMTVLETLTSKVPYEEVTNEQRVIRLVTIENQVPLRPNAITCNALWDIINLCWARVPSERPMITDVGDRLGALLPCHSPMHMCSQCNDIPKARPTTAVPLGQTQNRLVASISPLALPKVQGQEDRSPFGKLMVERGRDDSILMQVNEFSADVSKNGGIGVTKAAGLANSRTALDSDEWHITNRAERRGLGLVRLFSKPLNSQTLILALIVFVLCGLCLGAFSRSSGLGDASSWSALCHTTDFEEQEIESLCKLLAAVGRSLGDSKGVICYYCVQETGKGGSIHCPIFVLLSAAELHGEHWRANIDHFIIPNASI